MKVKFEQDKIEHLCRRTKAQVCREKAVRRSLKKRENSVRSKSPATDSKMRKLTPKESNTSLGFRTATNTEQPQPLRNAGYRLSTDSMKKMMEQRMEIRQDVIFEG